MIRKYLVLVLADYKMPCTQLIIPILVMGQAKLAQGGGHPHDIAIEQGTGNSGSFGGKVIKWIFERWVNGANRCVIAIEIIQLIAEHIFGYNTVIEFREYRVTIPANISSRIFTHAINPLDPSLQGIGIIQPLYLSLSDLCSCQRAMEVISVEGVLLSDQFIATGIDICKPVSA